MPLMSQAKGRHVLVFEGVQMFDDGTTKLVGFLHDQQFR